MVAISGVNLNNFTFSSLQCMEMMMTKMMMTMTMMMSMICQQQDESK